MSHTTNTEILEAQQEDFDEFLAKKDWKNAQAIIDNLWETGFAHEAEILRKELLKKQYQFTRVRQIFAPTQCTYSTEYCSSEDECECNQFSYPLEISLAKLGLFDVARTMSAIISKEPREMVWHKGRILITSLPSKELAF